MKRKTRDETAVDGLLDRLESAIRSEGETARRRAVEIVEKMRTQQEPSAPREGGEVSAFNTRELVTAFAAWLTTRPGTLVVGEKHEACDMAELVAHWCDHYGLPQTPPCGEETVGAAPLHYGAKVPAAEEPAFPLSREELDELATDERKPDRRIAPAFWTWWKDWTAFKAPETWGDRDFVVLCWRAAGCPGAEPVEEAQESAEGPWRLLPSGDGISIRRMTDHQDAAVVSTDRSRCPDIAFDLVSDANAYHAEREAREEAEAEAERVTAQVAEIVGYRGDHGDIPMTVRSLVRERDELREKAAAHDKAVMYLGYALDKPSLREADRIGLRELASEAAKLIATRSREGR